MQTLNIWWLSLLMAAIASGCAKQTGKLPVHDLSVTAPLTDWILLGPFETGMMSPGPAGVTRFGYLTDYLASIGGEAYAKLSENTSVQYRTRDGSTRAVKARHIAPYLEDSMRPEFIHILHDTHILERDFDRAVGYAFCYLQSDRVQDVYAYLGADGSPKVWCNGNLVFEHWSDFSKTKPWQYGFMIPLKKGLNPLLVKVDNWEYWWGLQMEVFAEAQHKGIATSRLRGLALDTVSYSPGKLELVVRPVPGLLSFDTDVAVELVMDASKVVTRWAGRTGAYAELHIPENASGEGLIKASLSHADLSRVKPVQQRIYLGDINEKGRILAELLKQKMDRLGFQREKATIYTRIMDHYIYVLCNGLDRTNPVDMTNIKDAQWLVESLSSGSDLLDDRPGAAWPFLYRATDSKGRIQTSWSYLTLPENYFKTERNYPLVVELHGSGQFGKRIAYRSDSYARIPAAGEPMIIVNPISPGDFQSYDGASWDPVLLDDFLHQLTGFLRVDEQRIYLEGASGGGKGAWEWAFHSPGHFAAMIVLVGGEGYPFRAEKLRNMPIMILNGELDRASYPFLPELMVHALQRVGNDPVYINYPDRGHSLTGKYLPEELKDWLLGQEGRAIPGPDPLDRWQLDTNGISEMGLIEVPDMTVFGLTEREDPAYPQDNLYRAAAKLYRAYRVTNGPVAERMADGVAFIHRTKNGGERMLLAAPPLEDLGTNGDLCLVETGPMKAARFYTVTEKEWPELQEKKKMMYEKIEAADHKVTGEEHSRLLTIMDADKRYWEVYIGIE